MEYDPNEMFREDPGDTEATPELLAELQRQEDAAQMQQAQMEEQASTPTGGQPELTLQPEVATAPPETEEEPFDKTKDFSYYEARGMSRGEWNRRQMATGTPPTIGQTEKDIKKNFRKLRDYSVQKFLTSFQVLMYLSSLNLKTKKHKQ